MPTSVAHHVTLAAASVAPEQALAGSLVPSYWGRLRLRNRADERDHRPDALSIQVGSKGRHFRAGNTARDHAEEIRVLVAVVVGSACQVGPTPALRPDPMTRRTPNSENGPPKPNLLGIFRNL